LKRLIRHRETKKFFRRGEWTADMALAQAFESIDQARGACEELNLHDVELYYSFGDGRPTEWDFAVRLT
jgi:hypothetical protein